MGTEPVCNHVPHGHQIGAVAARDQNSGLEDIGEAGTGVGASLGEIVQTRACLRGMIAGRDCTAIRSQRAGAREDDQPRVS